MKRGFPRPRFQIERLTGWYSYNFDNSGIDKSEWEGKAFPHPYSAQDDNLAQVCPARVKECTQFKKCVVCGEHVEGDFVWVYRSEVTQSLKQDSGPFHEKCKTLTQKMCPAVRSQTSTITFDLEKWSDVGPIIRGRS